MAFSSSHSSSEEPLSSSLFPAGEQDYSITYVTALGDLIGHPIFRLRWKRPLSRENRQLRSPEGSNSLVGKLL